MLNEHYSPINLFAVVPTLRPEVNLVLTLNRLLNEDAVVLVVKINPIKCYSYTSSFGQPSIVAETILYTIIKRLYDWNYEAAGQWVGDSPPLCQFFCLYAERTSDKTKLIPSANLIQFIALYYLLNYIAMLSHHLKVNRGHKLCIDDVVVETNLFTDSTFLGDDMQTPITIQRAKVLPPSAITMREFEKSFIIIYNEPLWELPLENICSFW